MGVRSEYQKQFKVSSLKKYQSIYDENVAFRTARRDREYAHTPLSWCDDDETDTASVESDEVEEQSCCRDVEAQKGKLCCCDVEENCKEVSTATVKLSNKLGVLQTILQEKLTDEEDTCDEEIKEPDSNGNNHNCEYYQDDVSLHLKPQAKKTTARPTSVVKSSRQRRPNRKQKIPRPSKKKQPSTRTPTPQSTVGHPAPFMSYGWAHTDLGPSHHKTYNVRSTADVHPDALRAQSRRKMAVKERAVSVQRSREDKVNAMLKKSCGGSAVEDGDWQSEYQVKYPAYDTSEYIRSLTARSHDVNDKRLTRVLYVS